MFKRLPYLWGFAAAVALDHAFDIQRLFVPVMLGLLCAVLLLLMQRREQRRLRFVGSLQRLSREHGIPMPLNLFRR